jgi:hypothetical protein
MRNVLVAIAMVIVTSCNRVAESPQPPPVEPVPSPSPDIYIQTNINAFDVSLQNENGQCVLFYSNSNKKYEPLMNRRITLDMEAPCNFIHLSGNDNLQFYEYGKEPFKFKIYFAVGGPPNTESPVWTDRFMPKGCGSKMQKLLFYDDRIRAEFPSIRMTACPSGPIDEVFFAT